MSKINTRGQDVREFILNHIETFPTSISKETAKHFGITRQAVNKHLQQLVKEHALEENGKSRNKTYKLANILSFSKKYEITPNLAEDVIWRKDIQEILGNMPENVLKIWHYGFTEMFNNAIDHSKGSTITVQIIKTALDTEITIADDGVGIFKKIQTSLNLLDERHAVLELSKGKLTTAPSHHSGQGIFFASRMFDLYVIVSGEVYFSHEFDEAEDWVLRNSQSSNGTTVRMKLNNHTARTTKKIFDEYAASKDDFRFNKTVVPVKLAQYGDDELISRSQAKRLLARIELFKFVIFDFKGVDSIGQAFADEVFRVFQIQHPEIEFHIMNENTYVRQMINRAIAELNNKL